MHSSSSSKGEPASGSGIQRKKLPKAQYCVFDDSCAGSPAFYAAPPRSAKDDEKSVYTVIPA